MLCKLHEYCHSIIPALIVLEDWNMPCKNRIWPNKWMQIESPWGSLFCLWGKFFEIFLGVLIPPLHLYKIRTQECLYLGELRHPPGHFSFWLYALQTTFLAETNRPRVSRKNQTLADFPKIVEYWHPTKNGGYRPEDFKATKPMELWLQCQGCVHGCGRVHEWKASATNLVQYGGNIKCPYCNGRGGKTCHCNSVANSEFLMKGYHPENPPPEIVPQRTLARISWICPECNLSYVSSPRQRLFYGAMCPHCNKTKTKHPSIADGAPHLLEEWDYSKNTESPHNLRLGSNLKVWWVCKDCHHNWETQVHHRALRNYGCMKCREAYRFSQRPIIENWPLTSVLWLTLNCYSPEYNASIATLAWNWITLNSITLENDFLKRWMSLICILWYLCLKLIAPWFECLNWKVRFAGHWFLVLFSWPRKYVLFLNLHSNLYLQISGFTSIL